MHNFDRDRGRTSGKLCHEGHGHKDPSCGCCGAWVEHLKAEGFAVEITETTAVNRVKAKLGVPSELASCHTAEVEGYVIEGHVLPRAIADGARDAL